VNLLFSLKEIRNLQGLFLDGASDVHRLLDAGDRSLTGLGGTLLTRCHRLGIQTLQ
jgi:hypothetical protein